ncbi:MAG: ribosome assembly cofactor RimP [Bacteroidales bacterium]|jgi:ribosome maturation factor RimP|nr:ribosome assembly cofactor RimP [Bacteroidales bacterium]
MIQKDIIAPLIGEYLSQKGLFLVEISVSKDNDIEIAIDSFEKIEIGHCADISKIVEQGLNREEEDFSLTVTSAGLDMPFRVNEQYRKAVGSEVTVLLKSGIKIVALLTKADNEKIELTYSRLEKIEGKKRREKIEVVESYTFDQIKSTKPLISFK